MHTESAADTLANRPNLGTFPWALAALLSMAACGDGASSNPSDTSDTREDTLDAGDSGDGQPDTGDTGPADTTDTTDTLDTTDTTDTALDGDGLDGSDGDADTSPPPWPWPTGEVTVTPAATWRTTLTFPDDPFLALAAPSEGPRPRWVKFLVFAADPTRIYFQDTNTLPTHLAFATSLSTTPPLGISSEADLERLGTGELSARTVLIGTVLYPARTWGAPGTIYSPREVGVSLVSATALPRGVVETVLSLVENSIAATDGATDPTVVYFPEARQARPAEDARAALTTAGFEVGSPARWTDQSTCHARGWAVGRLVRRDDEPMAAHLRGDLRPGDILMTRLAPDTLPPLAGLITNQPSSPASRAALLSRTRATPFVHLAHDDTWQTWEGLAGREVALVTKDAWEGGCDVDLVDLEGQLGPGDRDALASLRARPGALVAPRTPTAATRPLSEVTPNQLAEHGGLAVHMGLLARTLPDHVPTPSFAVSFGLFEHHVSPLAGAIAELGDLLDPIRELVTGRELPSPDRDALFDALHDAGLDTTPVSVGLSTNFTELSNFAGEGLHARHIGCLGDDLDADTVGPSACGFLEERPLSVAIVAAFAELWSLESYSYRRSVDLDEDQIRAGLVLSPMTPHEVSGRVEASDAGTSSRSHSVAAQRGAWLSSPVATPELHLVSLFSFGTYVSHLAKSSVGEYAKPVLGENDYMALSALIDQLQTAYAGTVPAPRPSPLAIAVDFDHASTTATFTGLRPLPQPSQDRTVTPYLLPHGDTTLCTFQGEAGAILGNHRLKSRVVLRHKPGPLGEPGILSSRYRHVSITTAADTFTGAPTTFTGSFYEPPTSDEWGNASPMVEGWVTGAGDSRDLWRLETTLPLRVSAADPAIVFLRDAAIGLSVTYSKVKPEPGQWPDGTTTFDYTRLAPCPEDEVLTPRHIPQQRQATGDGLTIDTRYWWPPTPTGIVAGYTAPLVKWDRTILTGLTSRPITLRGYWSQTYRPGHHNFSEDFVFEPRLEEGLDADLLAELEAKDIVAILVTFDFQSLVVTVIGRDGDLRPLAER